MFLNSPQKIQIEITNRCNLECAMCPRGSFSSEYGDMDLSVFEHILTKISPRSEVILTGWGEPLLHPHIFRMISLCKTKKFFTTLTTNGVLLDRDTAERIAASRIDEVSISVDSFKELPAGDSRHRFSNIEENIRNLIRARQNKKPRIILQPTLHKGKGQDIFEVVKKGKELGADAINVARLDRRFNKGLEKISTQEEKAFVKDIMNLSGRLKVRVDVLPFTAFMGYRRPFFKVLAGLWHSIFKTCPKAYNHLYITSSGKVTPCCGIPDYLVGDIFSDSLYKILHDKPMKEFRRKQNIVCVGCEVLTFPR